MDADGKTRGYEAVPRGATTEWSPIGNILRIWYDEAQWLDIGGSYSAQNRILVPDRGQDYLAAAQEFCEVFEQKHLAVPSGSQFRFSYVSCRVESAEDTTAFFRERGEIDEDTHAFYLKTAFVPENERALNYSMAGNTGEYVGENPDVPKGAYEYSRCGYITLREDGWHGMLVGTGW